MIHTCTIHIYIYICISTHTLVGIDVQFRYAQKLRDDLERQAQQEESAALAPRLRAICTSVSRTRKAASRFSNPDISHS